MLWLVLDAISWVTLPIYRSHGRRGHGSNFLTAATYSSQSNSKLYVQKCNYVPNLPIELAHFDCTQQHYVAQFEYVLWRHTMHECVMNIHYKTWSVQGRFTNIISSPRNNGACVIYHFSPMPNYDPQGVDSQHLHHMACNKSALNI